MQIIGIERIDYISKKTKLPVRGYTFHCVGDKSSNIGGKFCESYFINDDNVKSLMGTVEEAEELLGVDIRPYYNRYGSVVELDRLG